MRQLLLISRELLHVLLGDRLIEFLLSNIRDHFLLVNNILFNKSLHKTRDQLIEFPPISSKNYFPPISCKDYFPIINSKGDYFPQSN
jgi:hypothetical protein